MATTAEKQALGFLVLVALTGTAVRVVGVDRFSQEALAASPAASAELGDRALAAQIAAVDSARKAPRRTRARRDSTSRGRSSNAGAEPKLSRRGRPVTPEVVDINHASAGEIERLPRVGPALARRIVDWRERHGAFGSVDDLRHVHGIGPATVRLVAPLVTFSRRPRPLLSEGASHAPPFP